MKKQSTSTKLVGILLMVSILILAQSSFTRSEADTRSRSRVLLNNMPLTTATILLDARGALAMVEGDAANGQAKKIPIRVYVKRGEEIISQASSEAGKMAQEVEIGRLLMKARKGDELIVEPLGENAGPARQVFTLGGYTQFHWFPIPRDPGNRC